MPTVFAKDGLPHAAHDFGGHRDDAIRACDEAIRQLQRALNFDRRRSLSNAVIERDRLRC